ncbi:hypothetical protein ColTof3_13165 [Colletotrichum tofieldiae]|nr:hypothetical protein ColTof3_13165 [Colletotrichum tofieldiae]
MNPEPTGRQAKEVLGLGTGGKAEYTKVPPMDEASIPETWLDVLFGACRKTATEPVGQEPTPSNGVAPQDIPRPGR